MIKRKFIYILAAIIASVYAFLPQQAIATTNNAFADNDGCGLRAHNVHVSRGSPGFMLGKVQVSCTDQQSQWKVTGWIVDGSGRVVASSSVAGAGSGIRNIPRGDVRCQSGTYQLRSELWMYGVFIEYQESSWAIVTC